MRAPLDELTRRRVHALLVVGVLCALGVAVLYVAFVHTHWGQRVDGLAFDGRGAASPRVTRFTDKLLDSISRASLALLGAAIASVAVARGRPRLAISVVAAMAGAVVTTEILKHDLLTRPALETHVGVPFNTLPSGHATIGMVLACGLVMVVPHQVRWITAVIAALVGIAFGTGVVASGWHRPSDVLAAYLVALGWFCVVTAALLAWRGGDPSHFVAGHMEERLSPWAVSVVSTLGVGCLAVIAIAAYRRRSELEVVSFGRAYVALTLVIIALGVAVVATYYVLLSRLRLDPPHASPYRSAQRPTQG